MRNFLLKLFSVMFIACICMTGFVFADEESNEDNDNVETVYKKGTVLVFTEDREAYAGGGVSNSFSIGDRVTLAEDTEKESVWYKVEYEGNIYTVSPQYLEVTKVAADDGVGEGFDPGLIPTGGNAPDGIMNPIYKIWNTVIVVIRIAAFAGIIFAGVRYIYASADQKADLKKSLVPLVIGMVFVFASTILLDFIVKIFYDVIKL